MTANLFWEKLLEHFLLSTSAILVGAGLGWPTSKWFSRVLDRNQRVNSNPPFWVVILPWRAIVVTLIVLSSLFPRTSILLGLGIPRVVLALSVASFVLAAALLTKARGTGMENRPTSSRKMASLRTLATIVVALAIPGYKYFATGASMLITIALDLPELGTVWAGFAVVAIVALLFDVVLGYIQYRSQVGESTVRIGGTV